MKYIMFLIMTLMLSANVMSAPGNRSHDSDAGIDACPVGGCDFSVSCEVVGGNGKTKSSFYTGAQNYAVAAAMFIYVERGMHQFYLDLQAAATVANTQMPGSVDMEAIPDLESPLTPIFSGQ